MLTNKGSSFDFCNSLSVHCSLVFLSRRMLVQRRIQEEIHGGKSVVQEKRPPNRVEENLIEHPSTPQDRPSPSPGRKSIPIESRVSNSRRSQIEERVASSTGSDACKRVSNSSAELPPPLSDDDEMSTAELVARNQQKLDFHQTLTPMFVKYFSEKKNVRHFIFHRF